MSRDLFSKTTAWIYICLGGLAVLWDGIAIILEHRGHDQTNLLLALGLFGIGVLLAGLGAERLGPMKTLMETQMATMAALKNDGRFRCLDTPGKIYREAMDMVMESSNHCDIKATDLWPSPLDENEDSNFTAYVHALADKIKQATKEKGRVNYRLVYARDPKEFYKARLDHRRAQIADEHLPRRHVDNTFPLEVLIVGSSILIGFPDVDDWKPLKFAIAITDAKLAPLVGQWYDDLVFNKAKKEPPNRSSGSEEARIDR